MIEGGLLMLAIFLVLCIAFFIRHSGTTSEKATLGWFAYREDVDMKVMLIPNKRS